MESCDITILHGLPLSVLSNRQMGSFSSLRLFFFSLFLLPPETGLHNDRCSEVLLHLTKCIAVRSKSSAANVPLQHGAPQTVIWEKNPKGSPVIYLSFLT